MKKTLMVAGPLGRMLRPPLHAQSSVTLYGLIDAGITYTNSQLTSQGGHSNVQMTSGSVKAAAGACAARKTSAAA